MHLKKISKIWVTSLLLFSIFAGCFLFSSLVRALGISPPWIINHHLLRGSHFEKTVHINQGAPKESLYAKVEIKVPPEIRDWITIKPGMEFTIPIVQLFPINVIINVPQGAELGEYKGEIIITTLPEREEGAQVTVGIGVGIDLDLKVIEEEIFDYIIRTWEIQSMEEGWPVRISFTIKNKGNVKIRPIKVLLEVYDERREKLLGLAEATDLAYIEPFERSVITAEFPVSLKAGHYWARVKIYKNEEEVVEYEAPFNVVERGTLSKGKGWVFWLLVGIGGIVLMGLVILLWPKLGKKILAVFGVVAWPFLKIKKKFKKILKVLKEKEE